MRYVTKTTLNTHLDASDHVVIFIPEGEMIETTPEDSDHVIRVVWRGQHLTTEPLKLRLNAEPARPSD